MKTDARDEALLAEIADYFDILSGDSEAFAKRGIGRKSENLIRAKVWAEAAEDVRSIELTPRADLCADPALLAEAVEVLRFYADPTFNGYDVTIGDYGLSMDTGEIIKDNGDRARAFLSKLENRHDR